MARQRDYAAEYARRKARAQSKGYPSYYAERKAKVQAKGFPSPRALTQYIKTQNAKANANHRIPKVKGYTPTEIAEAHYEAFYDPIRSVKAKRKGEPPPASLRHWYVDILQHYTATEWDEAYGTPVR